MHLPPLQRATLSNGLKVVLAERHNAPVVDLTLIVNAGYAADSLATPGTAKLTTSMIQEGTKTRNSLQIAERVSQIPIRSAATLKEEFAVPRGRKTKMEFDPVPLSVCSCPFIHLPLDFAMFG